MSKLQHYLKFSYLNRWQKALGLLWPALWSLWFAGVGKPHFYLVLAFIIGSFAAYSLGHSLKVLAVEWSPSQQNKSKITLLERLEITGLLLLVAAICILATNWISIALAIIGLGFIILIAFAQENIFWSNFFLVIAWAWSVPIAFASQQMTLPLLLWLPFSAVVSWKLVSVLLKHKPKSTLLIACIQFIQIILFCFVGAFFGQSIWYFIAVLLILIGSLYQQWMLHRKHSLDYALRLQEWYGALLLLGTLLSYHY